MNSVYRPLAICIISGLLLLGLDRIGATHPLVNAVGLATQPVVAAEQRATQGGVTLFTLITSIKTLYKENIALRRQVAELQAKIDNLKEVEHENTILSQELNFTHENQTDYMPAQLIGRTPAGIIKDLIINRGSADKVITGQAVLAQGFLIGTVNKVEEHQATISLLTHPRALVPAMIQSSRATGLLRGGISGLEMTDLLIDAQIKAGDTVVTSGLGGQLPAGIPIGKVIDISSRKGDITKKASVGTIIDITKLEVVFIRKGP